MSDARPSDWCSDLSDALRLAETIRAHWRARGHRVQAWVVEQPNARDDKPIYAVRSNLFGGRPPA